MNPKRFAILQLCLGLSLSLLMLPACRSQSDLSSDVEITPAPPGSNSGSVAVVQGASTSLPVETSPLPQTPVVPPTPAEAASSAVSSASTTSANEPATSTSGGDVFVLDGMVGQVNGRAIYTRTIFDPIHEQLTQIGLQHPGMAFRSPAVNAIALRVNEVVQNALLLGEAVRDLDEQEQQGLAFMVAEHRQELLRLHGRGSAAVAERSLREKRGLSLDEAVEEYRSNLLVQRYLRFKLFPLINVTRRDIERYYQEHPQDFNPPPRRVLRLISTRDPQAAQQIAADLAGASRSFADLASSELNAFKPAEGGKMEIVGQSPLASEPLNKIIDVLPAGQYAGPIVDGDTTWFVSIESIDQPPAQSLKDAQLKIEQILREQQFRILSQRFRQKVMEQGSYTLPELMITRLYAIAEARYNPATLSRAQ
ncbi:MAG: peptidyl-prolyl cis-trans isomerase [Phycisphaeraceae bacterium]|nr:peptidyl-prolyl cis-trans isomerase [Phycisphaeraceae bacterium]